MQIFDQKIWSHINRLPFIHIFFTAFIFYLSASFTIISFTILVFIIITILIVVIAIIVIIIIIIIIIKFFNFSSIYLE